MTIIAFTGHRSNKLGGYELPNPIYNHVCQQIESKLIELKPDKIISGMALGVDQWAANIAIKLKIQFIAAIPFIGQEKAWPIKSQKIYHSLLNKSCEQVIVCPGGYSAPKMQIRNEFMVNKSDILIAVFDQNSTSGGTFNCIQYAKSINKKIIYINTTP